METPQASASEPILRLSVLDQAPISEGSTGGQALRNSIDLACLADRLGYYRYWLAEHHAMPMLACASPEAMIGPIAGATRRLRVGSGGVMLPHYSPVKVAETFSMLAGLYPGRIDLGLGRAPGSDQRTALALQRDRRTPAPDDFPQQLVELMAYLEDRMPAEHPFAALSATLAGLPERPELWLLGSSPQSGIWAAELALPYMFADFISPEGAAVMARYRQGFAAGRPGASRARPSRSRSSAPRPMPKPGGFPRARAWPSSCCARDGPFPCRRSKPPWPSSASAWATPMRRRPVAATSRARPKR
jgi:luciferase family oxidoreductase group 1